MRSKNIYWLLFSKMFFISTFTFGGGYVVLPMIRRYFVEENPLIESEELLDMAAIAQSSPGAIAVNISVLTGYHLRGIRGGIVAGIATTLPSLLILSVISVFYIAFRESALISAILKGMEAAVAATIVDFIFTMTAAITKEKSWYFTLLIPVAFIASFAFHVPVIWILIISIICSALYTLWVVKGKTYHERTS
ncbi:chromate transporter [Lacrimispora sp.]|uniref:chromate transporter n=1 Tax=Lacrimispora sp. TaxID=2719234 RepID=UPI00345F64E3